MSPELSQRCCDELAWRCETAKLQGVTFSVDGTETGTQGRFILAF